MPFYATPGVYVEEVPSGARPIGAVGTSTAAFVGVAPDRRARLGDATAVNSWTEFVKHYVGDAEETTDLANAVYGFFENGGGRCYVVNIEEGQPSRARPASGPACGRWRRSTRSPSWPPPATPTPTRGTRC